MVSVMEEMENPELVYHEDAFYLACDLSDDPLPLGKFKGEYERIVKNLR